MIKFVSSNELVDEDINKLLADERFTHLPKFQYFMYDENESIINDYKEIIYFFDEDYLLEDYSFKFNDFLYFIIEDLSTNNDGIKLENFSVQYYLTEEEIHLDEYYANSDEVWEIMTSWIDQSFINDFYNNPNEEELTKIIYNNAYLEAEASISFLIEDGELVI